MAAMAGRAALERGRNQIGITSWCNINVDETETYAQNISKYHPSAVANMRNHRLCLQSWQGCKGWLGHLRQLLRSKTPETCEIRFWPMLTNNVTRPGGPCRACGMHGKNRCPTCETGWTTFKKTKFAGWLVYAAYLSRWKNSETKKARRDVGSSEPPFKHYLPFSLAAKFGRLVTEGFIKAICFDRLILRMFTLFGGANQCHSNHSFNHPPTSPCRFSSGWCLLVKIAGSAKSLAVRKGTELSEEACWPQISRSRFGDCYDPHMIEVTWVQDGCVSMWFCLELTPVGAKHRGTTIV